MDSESGVTVASRFPPPRMSTAGNESLNSLSRSRNHHLGNNKDKYCTPWSKMREHSADTSMSLSLGMCLPKKSKVAARVNGPSTTPTTRKRTPSNRQTTIAQHMARFEKERIPNDKSSLISSHCSTQCQPGPPMGNLLDEGLFVLGHQKTDKRPSRHSKVRPINNTPVGEPFSMTSSALISPVAEPFVLESAEARARLTSPPLPSIARIPANKNASNSNNHHYWALEFDTHEKLRAATAATCRRRIGGKTHQSDLTVDGSCNMSQTVLSNFTTTNSTVYSASSSFRTKAHEARSSGYADNYKQYARSALLWPTADPDLTRRPTTHHHRT
jgi:hypothetical protein